MKQFTEPGSTLAGARIKPWAVIKYLLSGAATCVLACAAPARTPSPQSAPSSAAASAATSSPPPPPTASGAPQPIGHRFERAEQWARVFDDPARDSWQKPAEVVQRLRIDDGMTVADVGTGTGYFLPYLSRAVGKRGVVLAVDIEPDMIRYVGERARREGLTNVRPILGRTDEPDLPAGEVDRILIVDTWHHIPERQAYAAKLARALRAGGFVAIVDYTLTSDRGPPKHHRLAPEQVRSELSSAGLASEIIDETLPDQYIAIGRRR